MDKRSTMQKYVQCNENVLLYDECGPGSDSKFTDAHIIDFLFDQEIYEINISLLDSSSTRNHVLKQYEDEIEWYKTTYDSLIRKLDKYVIIDERCEVEKDYYVKLDSEQKIVHERAGLLYKRVADLRNQIMEIKKLYELSNLGDLLINFEKSSKSLPNFIDNKSQKSTLNLLLSTINKRRTKIYHNEDNYRHKLKENISNVDFAKECLIAPPFPVGSPDNICQMNNNDTTFKGYITMKSSRLKISRLHKSFTNLGHFLKVQRHGWEPSNILIRQTSESKFKNSMPDDASGSGNNTSLNPVVETSVLQHLDIELHSINIGEINFNSNIMPQIKGNKIPNFEMEEVKINGDILEDLSNRDSTNTFKRGISVYQRNYLGGSRTVNEGSSFQLLQSKSERNSTYNGRVCSICDSLDCIYPQEISWKPLTELKFGPNNNKFPTDNGRSKRWQKSIRGRIPKGITVKMPSQLDNLEVNRLATNKIVANIGIRPVENVSKLTLKIRQGNFTTRSRHSRRFDQAVGGPVTADIASFIQKNRTKTE